MTPDETNPMAEPEPDAPSEIEDEEHEPKRSLWGLVSIIIVIVIVIIVLLMLRNCGSSDEESDGRGDKTIERVAGLDPMDGVISLWIVDDASVGAVLESAGVRSENRLDMGGGRYVLEIVRGSEAKAIAALKRTPGVHDAGRVFEP